MRERIDCNLTGTGSRAETTIFVDKPGLRASFESNNELGISLHRLLAIALLAIALPACDAEHDDPVTSIDSKYISRAARYHAMDEGVVVIDPNSPRVITMDPWPQLVFLMSDGQHTVSQIINHLVAGYNDGPPDGLADQVRSIVRDLQREGILRIHEEPETLPTEIATPVPPPNKDT